MSDVPPSVVARVRKLLALSGNNSNENEATAAAEKAQAIMAQYNLEISQVGAAEGDEDAAREKAETELAASHQWQTDLMHSIATNNFCLHWVDRSLRRRANGTGKLRLRPRHMLIGRRANIAVTVTTYEYLVQAMDRLLPYTDRRDRSAESWFTGCTVRLVERLAQRRFESERAVSPKPAASNGGTALVLADVYRAESDANYDVLYGREPGTTTLRRLQREAEAAALAEQRLNEPATPEKAETAKEREARERREERWRQKWQREQDRRNARVDWSAYRSGHAKGGDIGLDQQIAAGGSAKRLG